MLEKGMDADVLRAMIGFAVERLPASASRAPSCAATTVRLNCGTGGRERK